MKKTMIKLYGCKRNEKVVSIIEERYSVKVNRYTDSLGDSRIDITCFTKEAEEIKYLCKMNKAIFY